MEKIFIADRELLITVAQYLESSEYPEIYITKENMNDGKISIAGERAKIDNNEAIKAISTLRKCGYNYISKRKEVIYFTRVSRFENDRGMAYTINGSVPDNTSIQFLINTEPLPEPNWYYYEADYEKWRSLRQ